MVSNCFPDVGGEGGCCEASFSIGQAVTGEWAWGYRLYSRPVKVSHAIGPCQPGFALVLPLSGVFEASTMSDGRNRDKDSSNARVVFTYSWKGAVCSWFESSVCVGISVSSKDSHGLHNAGKDKTFFLSV